MPYEAVHIFSSTLQERQLLACKLLTAAVSRRSLSNSYLFTGRAGADKWLIAQQLAAFLNCLARKDGEPISCLSRLHDAREKKERLQADSEQDSSAGFHRGTDSKVTKTDDLCQNCRWIKDDGHPQAWLVLKGEGKSGLIPVEKARQLIDEINKTSRYMRAVVIPHSEKDCLHAAPANALLKSIEEPHDNVLFLLFAASVEQVLPTIVSRSQVIHVISRFEPGLWLPESNSFAENENSVQVTASLEKLKSEFIQAARRRLSGGSRQQSAYVRSVSESQELCAWLLSLSEDDDSASQRGQGAESLDFEKSAAGTASLPPELVIDLLFESELELLRESSAQNAQVSLYLSKLAELAETSRAQLDHYVKKKNVLETFAYCLAELRTKYLGECCFVKK